MTLKELLIKVGAKIDYKDTTALFIKQEILDYELILENVSECAEFCDCFMETSNININVNDQTIWLQNGEDK